MWVLKSGLAYPHVVQLETLNTHETLVPMVPMRCQLQTKQ